MTETPYPDETMRQAAWWATWLGQDWRGEYPMKIHSGELSIDGSLEWHPDFIRWMNRSDGRGQRNNDQRLRTTRVMRRLRRHSVREYEVLYRILIQGERFFEVTKWLNERAAKNDIPFPPHRKDGPHYLERDTIALFIAGIDYVRTFW